MRTVAFADEKVVDLIGREYIAVWHNQSTESINNRPTTPEGEQPVYTNAELELYPEGGGGTNVLTYICDADGKIIHYVQGWWRPERYLQELTLGRELFAMSSAEDLVKAHRAHLASHQAAAEKLAQENPDEMKRPFPDSKLRRLYAALNLQAQNHESAAQYVHQPIAPILQRLERRHRDRGEVG